MKHKILFVLHLPPPIHGAAMMGQYILDSKIINNTFDCKYLSLTLAKDLNDIGKGGISKIITFIKQLYTIYKNVKNYNPEACYVTPNAKGGAFYKDFFVVMLLKILGKKIIIHYHNKGVSSRQDYKFDNFLYKLFFKDIKVILLSPQLYSDIKKYVNAKDIYYCPNGIPNTTSNIEKTKHSTFTILFLSNMIEEKGVWDLLEACKILKEQRVNFNCLFIGKWSDITEEDFKSKIKKLNLENCVQALGAIYGENKNRYLKSSDVFVFPTYYNNECFPLVLLEAMQHNLPCISTDEGGIKSIIENGKTGFIIQKNNPTELAQKIKILIDNPNLCIEMGKLGKKKFLDEFTLNKFEGNIKDILLNLCNND